MYAIHAPQRPGRPHWALAAGILLLLLAACMAWALIKKKAHDRYVPLGQMQSYPAGQLRCRLPDNWTPIPFDGPSDGIVAGLMEPQRQGRPGRQLLVFRDRPQTLGVASTYTHQLRTRIISMLGSYAQPGAQQIGPSRIGGLPAWTIVTWSSDSIFQARGASHTFCLARAAIAPGGQVVGIALVLPDQPTPADKQLLDKISEHVELLDVKLLDAPQEAMANAGITFEPPADAQFVANADPSLPRVRMMGGHGLACWYLDVHRVPLIGSRTPQDLLKDCAQAFLQQDFLHNDVQISEINERSIASISLSIAPKADPSVLILSTAIDKQTALLLVGRYESEGKKILDELAHSIAGQANVAGYQDVLDVAQARETARQLLKTIAERGLSPSWTQHTAYGQKFAIRCPAMTLGAEHSTYQQKNHNGTQRWQVVSELEMRLPSTTLYKTLGNWLITNDAAEHQFTYFETIGNRQTLEYRESRTANTGPSQVRRELSVMRNRAPEQSIPVDDTYACEPVLLQAAASVARNPEQGPAIFSTIETFTAQTVNWILVPLGKATPPGADASKKTWAVRLQRDHNPSPINLYYDQSERLVAIAFDNGRWRELVGNP